MYHVGIDIAKQHHDFAIIDENGNIILVNSRFDNNRQGFDQLHQQLQSYQKPVKIALEDTGHYGFNLLAFLHRKNYEIYTYNPLLVKEFSKSISLRKTKTDKKDALLIARKLFSDPARSSFLADPQVQELKYLTRHVSRMKRDLSCAKVQYTRLLDIMFPELADLVNTHNHYIYELLSHYPSTQKIGRAHLSTLIKIPRLPASLAQKIQKLAQNSIGTSSAALEFELKQVLQQIEFLTKQLDNAIKAVNQLMEKLNSPITTIPGISNRLGSVILAEIRNIHNFEGPSQLQAFAGLEPSIYQSGQMNVTGHMVKRGSSHLRWALIEAAKKTARYSPTFAEYLANKQVEGKHYNVAITHVARKLIRLIFFLLKNDMAFDEEKLAVDSQQSSKKLITSLRSS